MRTWLRRFLELALATLALAMAVGILLFRGLPMTGHPVLIVDGGSMEPAIGLGSAVVLDPVAPGALRVGDVVTMRVGTDQAIFTHRITRLVDRADGLWIATKGDANASDDPSLVPAASVIGRLTLAVPGLGFAAAAASQPSGVATLFGLAGLLLASILLLDEPGRSTTGDSRSRRAGPLARPPDGVAPG